MPRLSAPAREIEREVPKEMTQLRWKLLTLGRPVSPPPPCSPQPQPAWRPTPTLWVSRTKPERVRAQLTSQGTSSLLRLCSEVSWAFLECRLFQMHPFATAPGSGDGVSTRAPLLQTSHQKRPLLTRNYVLCAMSAMCRSKVQHKPRLLLRLFFPRTTENNNSMFQN